MADEPDNLVLAMLRRLDTKVDLIGGDLNAMGANMPGLLREVSGQTRTLDVLSQDMRMLRTAVNNVARVHVTSGKIKAMHHDFDR